MCEVLLRQPQRPVGVGHSPDDLSPLVARSALQLGPSLLGALDDVDSARRHSDRRCNSAFGAAGLPPLTAAGYWPTIGPEMVTARDGDLAADSARFEFAQPVVIDAAPGADHLADMVRSWTSQVTVVAASDIAALSGEGSTLTHVELRNGSTIAATATSSRPRPERRAIPSCGPREACVARRRCRIRW